MRFVVFDSGALIAIERGSRKVQTLLERINALGTIVLVPTGVVASVGVCAREHGRDVAVLTSDSTDLRKLDGTLPIVAI